VILPVQVTKGHSQSEIEESHLINLQAQITQAYTDFSADPSIIRHQIWHIFLVPLPHHLKQDRDSLQCFLFTYHLALKEQAAHCAHQKEAAAKFFFPRGLPTSLYLEGHGNLSSMESLSIDTLYEIPDESSCITPLSSGTELSTVCSYHPTCDSSTVTSLTPL
jgi:hypothetical protein